MVLRASPVMFETAARPPHPAARASLWNPTGLGFDADGNLYVVDATNARIRRIAGAGTR